MDVQGCNTYGLCGSVEDHTSWISLTLCDLVKQPFQALYKVEQDTPSFSIIYSIYDQRDKGAEWDIKECANIELTPEVLYDL